MEKKLNSITWNWKENFTKTLLLQGEQDVRNGKVINFQADPDNRWASCDTAGRFQCMVIAPSSYHDCINYGEWKTGMPYQNSYGSHWYDDYDDDFDDRPDERFSCTCSIGMNKRTCRHVASLMFYWEHVHGPFTFVETEEEAEMYREEEERRKEQERLLREREKKESTILSVPDVLKGHVAPLPAEAFFRMDKIAKDVTTNQYEVELANHLYDESGLVPVTFSVDYDHFGNQVLTASGDVGIQGEEIENVCLKMNQTEFTDITCSCYRSSNKSALYSWNPHPAKLCCHALLLFASAWEKNIDEMPGDETDEKAVKLLFALTDGMAADVPDTAEEEFEPAVSKVITLSPRITQDRRNGSLQLSFQIGKTGEREYILKGLEKLVASVDQKSTYSLSTKASIDFSREDFTEDGRKWFDFIQSRVRNIERVNRRINGGNTYYYYQYISVGNSIPLEGSDLDLIYDMTQGTELPSLASSSAGITYVKVQPGTVRADISLTPKLTRGKKPVYIEMSGTIPRLLQGNQYQYIMDDTHFGRVKNEDLDVLKPYLSIADKDGSFRCRIGLKKFPEFCYRVLPMLRSAPEINLHDGTANLNLDFLPPEPEFTFYIDMDDSRITCRPEVTYANDSFVTGFPPSGTAIQRDTDQENRVLEAVRKYFSSPSPEEQNYYVMLNEEILIQIMTEAVSVLSRFGEVKGSDAFHSVHVRPAPQPRFSVEMDGSLLELSIQTKDLSQDELLGLLDSYHEKKRWYRLKNGDYIDVRKAPALQDLENVADSIGISMEQLIRGQVQVPAYRSLYVDRLLEEHDAIAVSRDKHFKGLVRSFKSIQDSDFDVDESLSDVLRPYQLYGFRWISTLSQAGFGGILADEMGLGKTIQMLSYLLSVRQGGESRPALIVCPASLVYNWKEECQRFTGSLEIALLAGNAKSRKEQLQQIESGDSADIYVTSYDLLKRDITLFENIRFSTIVLDEAQFIKNQRAAVTKAVKILKADRRFALTGTPIENRLSELWSIFDFLMPGFLYSAKEFSQRFEGPIMKRKDPASTQKLSRMTSPFILRRKKMDVLKDLPEKLEEVQSFAMEDDQRRLYDAQVVRMRQMLENYAGSGEDKLRVLAQITKLRQVCCDPALLFDDYHGSSTKRAACLDLVERAIDSGHRMLLFSQFTSMLELLGRDLKKAGIEFYTITGATPKQERLRLVNDFNNGTVPVFLISLRAGGTGLNLVGADMVIHYDPWWNLAVQNQATDRAHRIGQTRTVNVVKMIATDTIEEKIIQLQEAKREMADAIMSGEGTSLASLTKEELLELVR